MAESVQSATQKTWLIIGASRGIGKEFVMQLVDRGDEVFATTRNDVQSQETTGARWLKCDVANEASIHNMVRELEQYCNHIDHVVLNAGVLKYPNHATEISFENFALHLHTNTIGPIITAQTLLRSSITTDSITFISSDSGSTQSFRDFEDGFAAYSASKAALNQSLRHMAAELKRKDSRTIILALHPGEVETDMAKDVEISWEIEAKILSVQESVEGCVKVIEGKGADDSGTFWTWEDEQYPW